MNAPNPLRWRPVLQEARARHSINGEPAVIFMDRYTLEYAKGLAALCPLGQTLSLDMSGSRLAREMVHQRKLYLFTAPAVGVIVSELEGERDAALAEVERLSTDLERWKTAWDASQRQNEAIKARALELMEGAAVAVEQAHELRAEAVAKLEQAATALKGLTASWDVLRAEAEKDRAHIADLEAELARVQVARRLDGGA